MPVVRRQQVNEASGLRCLLLEYYGCHAMGSINHSGDVGKTAILWVFQHNQA